MCKPVLKLHVDVQCSMGSFWWLMILKPPLPNQEVRWERNTKQHWAPATPRQSGCPWQHQGGLCQFWATSVPGLLWAQKNVRGEIWKPSLSSGWMAVHRTHSPTLSPIPSNLSPLHTEEKQKTVTGFNLSVHFFVSLESLHLPGRALSLTSSDCFISLNKLAFRGLISF